MDREVLGLISSLEESTEPVSRRSRSPTPGEQATAGLTTAATRFPSLTANREAIAAGGYIAFALGAAHWLEKLGRIILDVVGVASEEALKVVRAFRRIWGKLLDTFGQWLQRSDRACKHDLEDENVPIGRLD